MVTKINETKMKKIEREPLLDIDFNDTSEISVPPRLIDQVIGQDEAVEIIKKAALQRRHVLLIGEPGTGKSMLGQAMAELLPREELVDILCLPNPKYPNQPRIATLPAGHGARKVEMDAELARKSGNKRFIISLAILLAIIGYAFIATARNPASQPLTLLTAMFVGFFIFFMLNQSRSKVEMLVPKLLVDNSNTRRAPFNDATGSHAGALLGDVRHDPFQSLLGNDPITVLQNNTIRETTVSEVIDEILLENSTSIERLNKNNYEAVFLKPGELKVLADNSGKTSFVDVLSVNRYDYKGDIIQISTETGKTLIVTPNHKIAVQNKNGKLKYVEADKLNVDDILVDISPVIIDEEDIISTYSEKQQKQSFLYKEFLRLRAEHPDWGYKRLSKELKEKESKCRWWYDKKHIPKPIQTVETLRKLGLIPLTYDNPKLPVIARILGVLFGDGGIFTNLNSIFISSKERTSIEEFGRDLSYIFGNEITRNSRIIEEVEKGHSWCYQSTNHIIIRFFLALDAPHGNKSKINLHVPAWIYGKEELMDEFFGSYIGSELGAPKMHKKGQFLNTLDIGVSVSLDKVDNRMNFLKDVRDYLNTKGIKSTSIVTRSIKNNKVLVRLLISTNYENIFNFVKHVKINYCEYKKRKIVQTFKEFTTIKYSRYNELIGKGMGAEAAMKMLNLTPRDFYHIILEMEG